MLDYFRSVVHTERPYRVGPYRLAEVKLNQNECPFEAPPAIKTALLQRLMEIPWNRYPAEHPDQLCATLAAQYNHPESGILISNGSNDLAYTLGLSLIGPGTKVVLPRPMFALYEKVVRIYGGELIPIACNPNFSFDVEALRTAVATHDPALTVVTTPNNPTGLALTIEDVESIVAAASGVVLVDEAYVEFTEGPNALSLLDRYPNMLILRTLSKAYGLAGLRLGILIGHPDVIGTIHKVRLPFTIDPFAETIAVTVLTEQDWVADHVAQMKAGRAWLAEALASLEGVEVVPSVTNFLLFKPPVMSSECLAQLAASGVAVREMAGYPELAGYLRVNTGTEAENHTFYTALKHMLGKNTPA